MEKMLWLYLYMKVYAKMAVLCVLCGGIDTKTLRKWVWLFITAIAEMEPAYVRAIGMLVCVSFHCWAPSHLFLVDSNQCSSFGRDSSSGIDRLTAS